MTFDARDPYDAAALYDMWLNCQGCPTTFDFEPDRPIGLDYYHDIGQQAKSAGWLVREQLDGDEVDGISYMVLCPHCARRHDLRAEHQLTRRVPRAIEEICEAMQAAGDQAAA